MGRIGKILNTVFGLRGVREVRADIGGKNIRSCPQFQPANEDSVPLRDDYAVILPIKTVAHDPVVGYVDVKNHTDASPVGPGEKRIYSRDANGNIVAEAFFQADGTLYIQSDNGITVDSSNGVVINGTVTVDGDLAITGDITADGDIVAGTVSLKLHTHAGSPTAPTGPISPTGVPAA